MGEAPRKVLLSVDETMAETGLTRGEVRQLMDAGDLRSLRVGNRRRVHRASLDAFIQGDLVAARA